MVKKTINKSAREREITYISRQIDQALDHGLSGIADELVLFKKIVNQMSDEDYEKIIADYKPIFSMF